MFGKIINNCIVFKKNKWLLMIFRYISMIEMILYNIGNSYLILNRRKISFGDRIVGDFVDWSIIGL